jgi:hypothetical protein
MWRNKPYAAVILNRHPLYSQRVARLLYDRGFPMQREYCLELIHPQADAAETASKSDFPGQP